ncbi:MAG: hypothetical protein OHK0036_05970 [Bacteroidia bacterium]
MAFVFSTQILLSHQLDSLIKVNNHYHKVDTIKINLLIHIANNHIEDNDNSKAKDVSNQILQYSKKINYSFGIAYAYYLLGKLDYFNLNNNNAIFHWKNAAELFDKTGHKLLAGNAYFNISMAYNSMNDNIKSFEYLTKAKYSFEQIHSEDGLISVNQAMGKILVSEGLYDEAIEKYLMSLNYRIKTNEHKNIGYLYIDLGEAYAFKNEMSLSIDNYMKAINEFEKINFKFGVASTLLNLSDLYNDKMDNIEKAKVFIVKAYQIASEIQDTSIIIPATINMGIYYEKTKKYKDALKMYQTALSVSENYSPQYYLSTLMNLGDFYYNQKNFNTALFYYKKSYNYSIANNFEEKTLNTLFSIISIYTSINKLNIAKYYLDTLDKICKNSHDFNTLQSYFLVKYEVHRQMKDYPNAIKYLQSAYQYKDSVNALFQQRKVMINELNYEYKQRETDLKTKYLKEQQISMEKNRKQKMIIIIATSGLIISVAIGLIIFNLLKQSRKQNIIIANQNSQLELKNNIIEDQNQQLAIKNKDITDSIIYSKRIQNTILPDAEIWQNLLPESFVLYLPKDIVSGDFYFIDQSPSDNDTLFVAVADCTGHGVPGAFVSLICHNALSKSIIEDKLNNTNEILNNTREIVLKKLFSQSDEIKDGMDIALIRLNLKTMNLQYSGANRPLFIIRNNKLIELPPDKHPIGLSDNFSGFSVHNIDLIENDMIILFSDGYTDQFGGPKDKKLGTKKFKELILQFSHLNTQQVKEKLLTFINEWKMNNDQTDDITLIGIKTHKT